jgi:hypothetical protein
MAGKFGRFVDDLLLALVAAGNGQDRGRSSSIFSARSRPAPVIDNTSMASSSGLPMIGREARTHPRSSMSLMAL